MLTLLIVGIWILNFVISWFNARGVGAAWVETKAAGGWPRAVLWAGAVMSACGFTWCYVLVMAFVAGNVTHVPEGQKVAVPYLSPEYVQAMIELGYVMIIVPILGSGVIITLHSWREAWKRRTLGSGALAGWNTFAQAYNTYNAIRDLPGAFEHLSGVLFGKDSKKDKSFLVIVLVIVAVAGGILTTYAIARSAMRESVREARNEIRAVPRPAMVRG